MTQDDRVRVQHMMQACELAAGFVEGRSRADLDADLMLRFALVQAVQIAGRAAGRITAEGKTELCAIPWAAMIGIRNRLVHGYMDIDHEILWNTVTERLPDLLTRLRAIPDPPGP
jgi:uncharacterized protein with HEPN domain